ncbi:MAG TPA: hypothetical protein VJY36_03125 [Candidatus Bathyarchaeia archaeon]|nr:hypothetical protein [Candidatus Bathyarchaeia archaeon]
MLNIEKKPIVPLNLLSIGRLSEYLTAKTASCCPHVSWTLSLESLANLVQLDAVVGSAVKVEGYYGRN